MSRNTRRVMRLLHPACFLFASPRVLCGSTDFFRIIFSQGSRAARPGRNGSATRGRRRGRGRASCAVLPAGAPRRHAITLEQPGSSHENSYFTSSFPGRGSRKMPDLPFRDGLVPFAPKDTSPIAKATPFIAKVTPSVVSVTSSVVKVTPFVA